MPDDAIMEPNSPDWLSDLEDEVKRVKYASIPQLEILSEITMHPEILRDYTFPKLLRLPVFTFSSTTSDYVSTLIEMDWSVTELMIDAIRNGITLDKIVKNISWDLFEELVTAILEQSGWESKRTFRFKSPYSRRSNLELDVLAWERHSRNVLLIDCKRYKSTAKSPIESAAAKQVERSHLFHEALPDIYSDPNLSWVRAEEEVTIIPLIVTWRDHQIRWYEVKGARVPVVPIHTFLNFIRGESLGLKDIYTLKWSVI